MGASKIPPKTRARLRLGEDPYAFIEYEEEAPVEASTRRQSSASADFRGNENKNRQHDLFAPRPSQTAYRLPAVPSGNPYARIAQTQEDDESEDLAHVHTRPKSASKLDFRRQCTKIFRQYIPELEGGSLRSYMRDFIARNESRPGHIRYRLIQLLSRYDLSNLSAATPLFNREDENLAEQKLRDIESGVGEDE